MAPKKDPKKDKGPAASDVTSLYLKREPLAPPDPPNVEEIEDAWKVARDAFLCPLPEWEAERVDQTEWNPNEVETLYTNGSFSAKLLPRPLMQHITAWKRAGNVSDNTAAEEAAPEAKPPEMPEEVVEEVVDPKAKGKAKAKADPKAKAKGGKDEPVGKPGTIAQFADVQQNGESIVVCPAEFRTRIFELSNDDSMPPLSQAIAAQIAIIAEHRDSLPHGRFLWELIYPQNEDGVPLYNPHGKYSVKLYVQGKWREVLVDDVVPVGSATGSASLHAPILPSCAGNSIWPMILSKGLLRAYSHDLRSPIIPAIQALTGMSPFQLPLTWQNVRSIFDSRGFCCLQMSSKVDIEARQREALMTANLEMDKNKQKDPRGKGTAAALGVPALPSLNLGGAAGGFGGPQGPKLGANPVDALLQFLVCELEDDPQQVRMKAATWRPLGGTPRKVVLDVAESEGGEEDDLQIADQKDHESDQEDHDDDDDPEDRRSQRSPSGEPTVTSARSKEEPAVVDEAPDAETEGEVKPLVKGDWPETYPESLMPKSENMFYHEELQGGYWVDVKVLEDVCDSFIVYLSPGQSALTTQLDTSWQQEKRNEPYTPNQIRLLRVQLTPSELDIEIEPTPRDGDDEEYLLDTPRERGPPWHKTSFLYEPVRLDPTVTPSPAILGSGSVMSSCLLQRLNHWNLRATPKVGVPPEHINLCVTEIGGSSASRSVLLPSGEHWYLVLDDASKAGSVLSAHVDGAMLSPSKSSIEFVDPVEFLPELGVAMATVGTSEYPSQLGFSVWAKAEVVINSKAAHECIQLMSFVSDPALRANLRLSLLCLEQEACDDPAQRCARWNVTSLVRVPLQAWMALPLGKPDTPQHLQGGGELSVKYILMLEANVPSVAKSGTFSLHVMLPPIEIPDRPASRLSRSPQEEGQGEPSPPLELVDLKIDQITRWSGEVTPNEKRIILRERIVIPHGAGDATATIRVTVMGLPNVALKARLMAQLEPNQEMRPQVDGATPEPFQPGAPVDPKEYRGRQNWLGSKRVVAEESGMERVMFLHVLLCEGSTYLLDVFADPHKGPDKLEGGEWRLEMFGSSAEVEIGADTMEEDLEGLVRQSWEEPAADAPPVPRSDRAAKTRRKWLIKCGKLEATAEDDEAAAAEAAAAAAPVAAAKAEPKAKGKPGKDEPPPEPEINKDEQEAEWLVAALERAGVDKHPNVTVDEFVLVHTDIEPTLIEEDPYTIAPVLDDIFDEESPDAAAIQGLGMKGSAQVRQSDLESTIAKWEKIQEEVTEAKERNAQALKDLTAWSEKTAGVVPQFKELRETLRGDLQQRYAAKQALKDLVDDAEKLDVAELQTVLEEAERQEVSVWDAELVSTGGQKKLFIEDFSALRDRLGKLEAEPLADEASRGDLSKLSASVGQLQKELKKKKLPLPPNMFEQDLLQQASEAIAASIALMEEAEEAEGS